MNTSLLCVLGIFGLNSLSFAQDIRSVFLNKIDKKNANTELSIPEPAPELIAEINKHLDRTKLSDPAKENYLQVITSYLTFIGLDPVKDKKYFGEVSERLFDSSLQFLTCENISDWTCLEKTPEFTPEKTMRVETSRILGAPFFAGERLDLQYFFSHRWKKSSRLKNDNWSKIPRTVAPSLAKVLSANDLSGVDTAIYGIDDISGKDPTLKPVYDGFSGLLQRGGVVRAVLDANDDSFRNKNPVPNFFYKGTQALLDLLNQGVSLLDRSMARVEYFSGGIMHNKFLIFKNKNGNPTSVWTGTSNLSRSCMGDEENTNLSVFIRNVPIAQAFQDEFDEMFKFDPSAFSPREQEGFPEWKAPYFPSGRVHSNKLANTRRYFYFGDGTEVRIHFSPTDDAEHRSIIPMIYSARPGDLIRIAMFGSGGLEMTRALQWAAKQGVQIYVIIDAVTGKSVGSWVKEKLGGIQGPNPYGVLKKGGGIWVRADAWSGSNHLKTATLSRIQKDGSYINDSIIFGSQNWSESGNDQNDENTLTIRNWKMGVPVATAFNRYFDEEMWELSIEID